MCWARLEMEGANLGHGAYKRNSISILSSLGEYSGLSFSSALGPRLRKAAHRLFSQTKIDLQLGHRQSSVSRSEGKGLILALQDTPDVNFNSHKQKTGMGNLGGRHSSAGINIHSILATTTSGEPLGVIGQYIFAPRLVQGIKHRNERDIGEKESYKWIEGLKMTASAYERQSVEVLVVCDREGEFYEHLSYPRPSNIELLVRGNHLKRNIIVKGNPSKVRDLPSHFPVQGYTTVEISRQQGRNARIAKLAIRFGLFTYPASSRRKGENLVLSFVHAREVNTVKKDKPVEWYLFTTLPIDDLEQALQLIAYYTKRWIIERFHYVLKTGLHIEKLQISTFERLVNALQIYSIVAWRILHLAYLGKVAPQQLAINHFGEEQIRILKIITRKEIQTVKQYILALGALVGFSPSKKQPLPGEKLLWFAISQLNLIHKGFQLNLDDDP